MPPALHQIPYFVPDAADTWVRRMEAACLALERAFEGERLRVSLPYRERDPVVALQDREGFFRKKLRTRTRWFCLYDRQVDLDPPDREHGRFFTLGGRRGGGFEGHFSLSAIFPAGSWAATEKLLVDIGDAAEALTGRFSPRETEERLWRVQLGAGHVPVVASDLESRLPKLGYAGLQAPEQPFMLGWLNYWSEATARYLGFPDARRDGDLLEHSYRTPGGAWLVKLGSEPLDHRVPRHVEMLVRAYERFPTLGVRAITPWHR